MGIQYCNALEGPLWRVMVKYLGSYNNIGDPEEDFNILKKCPNLGASNRPQKI